MEICQRELPIKPWMETKTRRLPGIQPVAKGEWLLRDDAFAAQMAYRDALIASRLDDVFLAEPASLPMQEELLIMDMAAEPRLTAGVLCFPASWSLAEKFGAGLEAIHGYIDEYTEEMAARVRRMFDAIRPEQLLWRANFLRYAEADLHQPRRIIEAKPMPKTGGFVRVERQTLRKLPRTGAVVFGIHTYVIRWDQLSSAEQSAFFEASA